MTTKTKKRWSPDAMIRRDGGSWFDGRSIRTYDRNGQLVDQRHLKPGDQVASLVSAVKKRNAPKSLGAT